MVVKQSNETAEVRSSTEKKIRMDSINNSKVI